MIDNQGVMPNYLEVIWTKTNIAHLAEHGVTPEEVEEVLGDPIGHDVSRSSGHPIAFGYTLAGRRLAVVYEVIDDVTVYPKTAYDVE